MSNPDMQVVQTLLDRIGTALDTLNPDIPGPREVLESALEYLADAVTDDHGDPLPDPAVVAVATALLGADRQDRP